MTIRYLSAEISAQPPVLPTSTAPDGCSAWLATHLYDLSGLDLDQGLFYQRQQRPQVVDIVTRRHHDYDRDPKPGEVLLMLNPLVDRQEDVERPVGSTK